MKLQESNIEFCRCLTNNDINIVSLLAREIYSEHYSALLERNKLNYWIDLYQSVENIKTAVNSGEEYYLIRNDNAYIGYFAFSTDINNEQMFLSKLYLQKNMRMQGIGKKSMLYIFGIAKNYNLKKIYLKTMKKNTSVKFYERLGFCVNKEVETDLGNGLILKDFIMSKKL